VPYYWFGIKMYDWVSGKRLLKNSYYINKEKALERFPMLKKEQLKGALIYYDGFDFMNDCGEKVLIFLRPTQ
jgi:glycerol-3-phosphate dehydrogenase